MSTERRSGSRGTGRTTRRTVLTWAVTVVALAGVGVAAAVWLLAGQGMGPVASAGMKPLGVQVDSVSGLYPGATLDSRVSVSNPNPYPVAVITIRGQSFGECFVSSVDQPPAGARIPAARATDHDSDNDGVMDVVMHVSMPLSAPPSCSDSHFSNSVSVEGSVGQ